MTPRRSPHRPKLTHDGRIFMLTLAAGLPAIVIALVLLWRGSYSSTAQWTATILVLLIWFACASAVRRRVTYPLQTLSNLLAALGEGDFSIRARGARREDALGEVLLEVNTLGGMLREQRLGALEASALLSAVMSEIDVAIFTFDDEGRLRLVNRGGERLLAQPAERLLGRRADEINLAGCLGGEPSRTVQMNFPGAPSGSSRWGVHRSTFRQGGLPHQLLVLSDLSQPLREEERQAWRRLIRVIGHELNNSLAPIKSMAASLEQLLAHEPQPPDWKEDMQRGLRAIGSRAAALSRFMEAYARLARLPQPRLRTVDLGALVRRVAGLETRLPVELLPGPELTLQADPDQLEQLLINLLRNAVDAAIETRGGVTIRWTKNRTHVDVVVEDDGPGLASTANLFVPFFTTKPAGSGIGLVISRQIAEAHAGTLTLRNRPHNQGCIACLRLPV